MLRGVAQRVVAQRVVLTELFVGRPVPIYFSISCRKLNMDDERLINLAQLFVYVT